MYIIAGLGNPGKQYEHTRHNVGFEVIDRLAKRMGISMEEKKHKALCGRGRAGRRGKGGAFKAPDLYEPQR